MEHSSRVLAVLWAVLVLITFNSAASERTCDGIHDPDVKYFDIRLPVIEVPENLTTYVCQLQHIPVFIDEAYHAVAFEPIIDNADVMHHMILFGCQDTGNAFLQKPHVCGGSDNRCRNFLVQWSMGIEGPICSHPDTGVRFGRGSLNSMALQIHWNNMEGVKGMNDSSGVRVYYTTKLRSYDVGNIQVGQNDLEIPPGQERVTQTGSCSSECTQQWLSSPIFLTRAHIHMHYLGAGGVISLVRNGQVVQEIVRDPTYDYNSPPAHYFQPPVQVLPGDEVKVTCFFNSKDGVRERNRTVYWGEGSDGEMCYAFITYYPKVKDFDQCIQFDHYDICPADGFAPLGECVLEGFTRSFKTGIAGEIIKHCGTDSLNDNSIFTNSHDNSILDVTSIVDREKICSRACDAAIREVTEHPCMQDRVGKYAMREFLPTVPSWRYVRVILDEAIKTCVD